MNNVERLEAYLHSFLNIKFRDTTPSDIEFINASKIYRIIISSEVEVSDEEFDFLIKRIQEIRGTNQTEGHIIVDHESDHIKWYIERKKDLENSYSNRYSKYLLEEKLWSPFVVKKLDVTTDTIMDFIGDPQNKNAWNRKGLIIGDVQSGKTANYTSICNKAIDSGYKVIIVLAGLTNTLRRQTQLRLEKELVGTTRITSSNLVPGEVVKSVSIGVGKIGKPTNINIDVYTSDEKDFSKKIADTITNTFTENMTPKLFVIKKVKSVLSNLYQFMRNSIVVKRSSVINVPVLIIDDESDNASVNTRDETNPSTINNQIRSILNLFTRSTYLGITATPFANIFINPYQENSDMKFDPDLFPGNFIYSLSAPSNYMGSEQMFSELGEFTEGALIEIPDKEMELTFQYGHKKYLELENLPNSMIDAFLYFLVSNAIRDYSGHKTNHKSMLINVSRYVDVQNRLRDSLEFEFKQSIWPDIVNFSKLNISKALKNRTIYKIKEIWKKHNLDVFSNTTFQNILNNFLFEANEDLKIFSINQKSLSKLDYENYPSGLTVVAIGGNCLSRGLTLEGLCVSYFYRNSQAYDTLMQMGRWFGYRLGYSNLVRLWISVEASAWYRHISDATEELKLEIIKMNKNDRTPRDFGLKVQGHPDSLIPTARNKMKNASLSQEYCEIDIAGRLIESPRLPLDFEKLKINYRNVLLFISSLNKYGSKESNQFIWRNLDYKVISELVSEFKSLDWHWYFDSASLANYIIQCADKWDVCISQGNDTQPFDISIDNIKYTLAKEIRKIENIKYSYCISGSKVRVGSGGASHQGLTSDERKILERNYTLLTDKASNFPDSIYLHTDRNPVLFIHFITPNPESSDSKLLNEFDGEIVALGLGFVNKNEYNPNYKPQKIKYYLNKIASEINMELEEGDDNDFE